jgi:hypothetical protein
MSFKEIEYDGVKWIRLAQDTVYWRVLVNVVMDITVLWNMTPCSPGYASQSNIYY